MSGKNEGWPKGSMKKDASFVSAAGMKTLMESINQAVLNEATAHADGPDLKRGPGSIKSVR